MSQYLMPSGPNSRPHQPLFLIPIAVLLAIHPLLIHGPSAGQDLAFHLQSWLDDAAQLRHGNLCPHWDITAAWNAGEPRFLFYPPLSWILGAILTLAFPPALCPTIFIAIALLLSGLTFHKLASAFASPTAALLASTLYLANPYMLFTAYERSAYAELLAAAWIPLLLLPLLRPYTTDPPDPPAATIRNIAIPLALLWLTNAPAAVIGSYTLALLATLHVLTAIFAPTKLSPYKASPRNASPYKTSPRNASPYKASASPKTRYPEASASGLTPQEKVGFSPRDMPSRLALTYIAATLLGLTLPALYLLPAAYERRNVQTAMALLPNMRYQDNFLFSRTTDPAHNAVNQTVSLLAVTLLLTAVVVLLALFLSRRNPVILSEARSAQPKDLEELPIPTTSRPFLPTTLALLTLLIAFLLTPLSAPIWLHLPNLAYLQFPWRLLILLTPILALSLALLFHISHHLGAPSVRALADGRAANAQPSTLTTGLALLLPFALAIPAYRLYHQPPDPTDDPTHLAQLFATHHGFPPTDEYTPTAADNDPLRSDNPAYWLAPSPNDPAPNTTPTAAELNPNLDTDDTPLPDAQTLSTPAPHHVQIHTPTPNYLILNLRAYPNWRITTDCEHCRFFATFAQVPRNDGLIAIALPTGDYTINLTWHRTLDQQLGLALTLLALIALALTYRSKSIDSSPKTPSSSAK